MATSGAETSLMDGGFVVERGSLLCIRIFDVADEIDLDAAEQTLLGSRGKHRVRPTREGSRALSIPSPPIAVPLGQRSIDLPIMKRAAAFEVVARLYDSGAATVLFELALEPGTTLTSLLPLCDELYDTPVLEAAARPELDGLLARLGPAVKRPTHWEGVETYTVIFVEELRGRPRAAEVLASPDLAGLLLGEAAAARLATEERNDVLNEAYSYLDDDLAVVDWNSGFVLEPSGSRDIPAILEFANVQLLEMRLYDERLDRELQRIYDEVERAGGRPWSILWSPYPALARRVLARLLELTELTERVENSLKLVGDFYLARLYRGAVRRFRLSAWQGSVYRKQSLVAQVYGLLNGEIATRRNTVLEVAVVVLILLEVALALR